ncbi:MAG: hypothetical protein B6I37_02140 [Desulfobacteraceae bacterium 4572_35.2]|nr:MAG: hypothetical protein B6I37_02140 [Desulfobacteraceae bacterium 4572_35.2]
MVGYQYLNRPLLSCSLLMLFSVAGCSEQISAKTLKSQLKRKDTPMIIDVRSQGEYQNGHIPGAVHIPFWAVIKRRQQIVTSEQSPAVLYCESGGRAVLAKGLLSLVGKKQLQLLDGHMMTWRRNGFPLER